METKAVRAKKGTTVFPWLVLAPVLLCLCVLAASCASSSYYRLNLRYVPQKNIPPADTAAQRFVMTVAAFNDDRNIVDKASVGKRIKSDGAEMKAISQQLPPSGAVAAAIKDFFFRHGYTLYGGMPEWDLSERSIDGQWGTLVLGGTIEALDITSTTGFANVEYDATVRLNIVFADVQHKKILYSRTLESTSSFKHVRFKEGKMEEELNSALSTAVEKIFEDNKIEALISDITRVRAEGLSR